MKISTPGDKLPEPHALLGCFAQVASSGVLWHSCRADHAPMGPCGLVTALDGDGKLSC